MNNLPTQKQSNVITEARYEYSIVEKRIALHIIKKIQDRMGADSTLFGEPYVRINVVELVQDKNYRILKEAVKSLRHRDFFIENENGWLDVGFIASSEYKVKEGIIEFELSKKIIPYLIDVAKGFTVYQLNIALSLRSVYSQRFYEFCAQFRSTGVWRISIEDLKSRLMLDNSPTYNGRTGNGNLKLQILDKAKKEIKTLYDKGECDLYFTYTFKKTGRVFTDIEFKIFSTKNPKHEADKETDLQFVSIFLNYTFPNENEKKYKAHVLKELFNKGRIGKAAHRFAQLEKQVEDGDKKPSDIPPIVRDLLKKDYGI